MVYTTARRDSRRRASSLLRAPAAAVLVIAGGLTLQVRAASDCEYRFRAGLHISRSRPLSAGQLRSLLEGLRFWTGLSRMDFDESGALSLGDRERVSGGSATARALLAAAVDGRDCFIVENHLRSPAVAFTQLEATADFVDASETRHAIWRLKIDFEDFRHIRGGVSVVAAFDPAINLLHELGHGVLKKSDTVSREDQLGECERHINRIRAELGLPERQHYHPRGRMAVTPGSIAETLQAELMFVQTDAATGRKKNLYLIYEAERVSTVKAAGRSGGRAETLVPRR